MYPEDGEDADSGGSGIFRKQENRAALKMARSQTQNQRPETAGAEPEKQGGTMSPARNILIEALFIQRP